MSLIGNRFDRLDNTWLIPPENAWLPLLSVTVLGEDEAKPVTAILNEFIAKWEDAFGVSGRSAESRTRDLVAGKNWCVLVLILASQTPKVLTEAAAIVEDAGELDFDGVVVAALGEHPAPALEKISEQCVKAIIATEIKLLLHPLRLLINYLPLISYDFSDIKSIYAGRLAAVLQSRIDADAQPPVEMAQGADVTGCCCLMLSNAEGRLATGDAMVSPMLEYVKAEGLDFIWAINGHWEAEDYIEWAIIRDPQINRPALIPAR
jgi:hypothetical protein